jgi:hypothetical protein
MNKTIRAIIAVLLALLLGISIVVDATIFLPEQFDHLYLGELADKYLRLRSFDNENKIIVIGGSSVAFGINSQLMEEYLGMPVVNFGLYGPLGTTVMMDLTRGHINEGDIIVLAPETDEQTMSMYFNGEAMWECADSDFTMLLKIRPHNWGDMIGSFWQYAQKKFQFYLFGKPEPDGVYDHDSFNEYGDIIYTREEPVMEDWYDPDVLVNLDSSIVEDEFIDYVNEYIAYCESQGATVYYSWPPMNYLAVEQDYAGVLEYATYIRENINCQVISNISDYIMDAGYFYDTNYHVTDQGAIAHTAQLIQDLENFMGDGSLISISRPEAPASDEPGASGEPGDPGSMPLPKGRNSGNTPTGNNTAKTDEETESESADETVTATPAPTATPVPEVVGSSQDAEYFTYDVYNEGLMLTGVTEEGKAQTSLEVPWLIDGQKVIAIGQNTFDGCDNLKSIYIQSNITRIMQNAFDGCARLTEIHIDNDSGTNILIPGSGLFDNVSSRTKVYVPKAYYGNFLADYFWGNYNDRLVAE